VVTVTNPRDKLTYTEPLATGEVAIDAPPGEVYRLVSDPVAMADFAEEFYKARCRRQLVLRHQPQRLAPLGDPR
jgi:hypothetical protein